MKLLTLILLLLILANILIYQYGKNTTKTYNQSNELLYGQHRDSQSVAMASDIPLLPFYPQQIETITAEITAYTLSVEETDQDPLQGACGSMVGNIFRIIACPRRFSCGDVVEIDNIKYTCWDRMALKNDGKFDILMDSRQEALNFGRQIKEVKILYFNN